MGILGGGIWKILILSLNIKTQMKMHDSLKFSRSVAKSWFFRIRGLKAIGSIGSLMMRTMRKNQWIQWKKRQVNNFENYKTLTYFIFSFIVNYFIIFSRDWILKLFIIDAVYELYIVGGYADDAGKAKKISHRFFKHLHDLKVR